MNQTLTEIVCILDRSGSMQSMRDDAIGGFNAFLEEQKKLPGAAHLTVVLFDHEYDVLHQGVDIQQVAPLNSDTYVPRGQTALLDAVGRTVDDVGRGWQKCQKGIALAVWWWRSSPTGWRTPAATIPRCGWQR